MRPLLVIFVLTAAVAGCTQEPAAVSPDRVSASPERSGAPDPAPADAGPYRTFSSEASVALRVPNPLIREACYATIDNCRTFAQAEGVDHAILRFEDVPVDVDLVRFHAEYGSGLVSPDYRVFDATGSELPFSYFFMLQETWANSTTLYDAQQGSYQVFLWMPHGVEQEFQVRFEAYDFPS